MTILKKLLEEIDSHEVDEQLRILCDQIFEEEKSTIEHIALIPKGPNVFLALEVPGRRPTEVAFVSLERELAGFVIVTWTIKKSIISNKNTDELPSLKKVNAVEVEEWKAENILKEYAKFIKHSRGQ